MGRGNAWSRGPSWSKQGSLLLGDGRGWETAATPVGSQIWGGAAGSLRALVQEDGGRGGTVGHRQSCSLAVSLMQSVSHLPTPSIPEVH